MYLSIAAAELKNMARVIDFKGQIWYNKRIAKRG
jgi:hypothetical protein